MANIFKLINQNEHSECGLACIAMVLNYHGHEVSLIELRAKHRISSSGSSFADLVNIADCYGLVGRIIRAEPKDLSKIKTPCILHWNMNHFVVLKAANKNSMSIADPAGRELELSLDDVSNHFTGYVLELSPTKKFERKIVKDAVCMEMLWSDISGLKRNLIQVLILSLLGQALIIAAPLYLQSVIDSVIPKNSYDLLLVIALAFLFLVVFQQVVTYVKNLVLANISSEFNHQLSLNLFRHLFRLPIQYFERRDIGDISSRFDSLSRVRDFFTNNFVESIIDLVSGFVIIFLLFMYSPEVSFVVVISACVYAIFRMSMFRKFKSLNESEIRHKAIERSKFIESVQNVQTIKSLDIQARSISDWSSVNVSAINSSVLLANTRSFYHVINSLIFGIENVVVVYLLSKGVLDGVSTIGVLTAYVAYKRMFTQRFTSVFDKLMEYKMLRLHLERISDIALTEIKEEPFVQEKDVQIKKIELLNISYRNDEFSPYLFSNLNLVVEEGEHVAIVGRSGVGKSTLVKIIIGLISPTSGNISINSEFAENFGWKNFRDKVSVVMQDDKLFSGSIEENITMFDSTPDHEFMVYCAQKAHIHDVIVKKKLGYSTFIPHHTSGLSIGEKQRILLARALYKRPSIMIMDESTSALDIKTEIAVVNSIKELGITRIVVAHRPQTINAAGKIYELTHLGLNELSKMDSVA